jgi:hypothetical protein
VDTVTLVDEQIRDGEKLLGRLVQEGLAVQAAGWVKPADEDRWSLYLVTPLVDEKGLIGAYREVNQVLRSLEDVWVKDYEISLVSEDHPVAKNLLDLARRRRAGLNRPRHPWLGGSSVEDVYVYPPAETRLCLPVAYIYRREERPGSKRWHMNSQIIAPSPNAGRPGFLHVLEDTSNQVILIFAVPCDEKGGMSEEAREEYEDLADETFSKLRPTDELA